MNARLHVTVPRIGTDARTIATSPEDLTVSPYGWHDTNGVDGAEFTVVGVYAKAKGGFFGQNGADTQMVIPLKTAEERYPNVKRYIITAKAKPGQGRSGASSVNGTGLSGQAP